MPGPSSDSIQAVTWGGRAGAVRRACGVPNRRHACAMHARGCRAAPRCCGHRSAPRTPRRPSHPSPHLPLQVVARGHCLVREQLGAHERSPARGHARRVALRVRGGGWGRLGRRRAWGGGVRHHASGLGLVVGSGRGCDPRSPAQPGPCCGGSPRTGPPCLRCTVLRAAMQCAHVQRTCMYVMHTQRRAGREGAEVLGAAQARPSTRPHHKCPAASRHRARPAIPPLAPACCHHPGPARGVAWRGRPFCWQCRARGGMCSRTPAPAQHLPGGCGRRQCWSHGPPQPPPCRTGRCAGPRGPRARWRLFVGPPCLACCCCQHHCCSCTVLAGVRGVAGGPAGMRQAGGRGRGGGQRAGIAASPTALLLPH